MWGRGFGGCEGQGQPLTRSLGKRHRSHLGWLQSWPPWLSLGERLHKPVPRGGRQVGPGRKVSTFSGRTAALSTDPPVSTAQSRTSASHPKAGKDVYILNSSQEKRSLGVAATGPLRSRYLRRPLPHRPHPGQRWAPLALSVTAQLRSLRRTAPQGRRGPSAAFTLPPRGTPGAAATTLPRRAAPPASVGPALPQDPSPPPGLPRRAPAGPRRPRTVPHSAARRLSPSRGSGLRPASRSAGRAAARCGGRGRRRQGRPRLAGVLRGGGGRADRCLLHFALQCQRLQQRGLLTARPARAPGPAPPPSRASQVPARAATGPRGSRGGAGGARPVCERAEGRRAALGAARGRERRGWGRLPQRAG